MKLRNKHDWLEYRIESESYEGGIRIFAIADQIGAKDFVMTYHTLDELLADWEDVD